jgi:predicted CXXCH cytochrome family protein
MALYDSYMRTGMGRSFAKATEVPALDTFVHTPSGRHYSVVRRNRAPYLRRSVTSGQGILEKSIDFVVGSGNHSKTFVHRDQSGRLLELPISWYAEKGGYWAMSPGYDRPDHSDLRREISDTCLFCHNGYPSQANGGVASGIDCQRCHGPGEAHVKQRAYIVNPGKLSREGQLDVCMQCHLESASRTLPDAVRRFERSIFAYRPGEPLSDYKLFFEFANSTANTNRITVNNSAYGLRQSKCFQKSGTLTCTTCHDPHAALSGDAAEQRYTSACRSCHATTTSHPAHTKTCAGCHMRKRRTEDAVHVVMTDHLIRRKPLAGDLLAPLAERDDRQTGPVQLLHPRRLPNTAESRLYIAVAQIQASANVAADISKLERAIKDAQPWRPEPYAVLAEAYKKAGRNADAIRAYRSALDRDSNRPADIIALSELLAAANQLEKALAILQPAARRNDKDAALWNTLSVIHARAGRLNDALAAVSKAIAIDPDDPVAWLNMGVCLEARKDKKGAEAAYRQALLLQPDLTRATDYLQRLLENEL